MDAFFNTAPLPPQLMESNWPPGASGSIVTLIPNRIFVGGMSRDTTEMDLQHAFSTYGNVRSAKIIKDERGCSKGYGFVTFASQEEAQRMQQDVGVLVLHNRRLNIGPAIRRQLVQDAATKPALNGGFQLDPLAAVAATYTQQMNAGFYQPMFQYYTGIPFNFPTTAAAAAAAMYPPNYQPSSFPY